MTNYNSVLRTAQEQWNKTEIYFSNPNIDYKDVHQHKTIGFLKSLFEMIEYNKKILLADTINISYIIRAAAGEGHSTERFIPDWQYAKENRMNGPDKLYYYFGITYKASPTEAIKCCLEEIRLDEENATICNFKLKDNLKILDLSKDPECDIIKLINNSIIKAGNKKNKIETAMIKIYLNFFYSSGAFDPIDKENDSQTNIRKTYMPFWTLSHYLESIGIDGLVFNSTVYECGKNLVIFNLNNAEAISSSIKIISRKSYFFK